MTIIDVGNGPPVVLVPGIQGRWEWMRPTVDALAARCRVITFSLADEPTCGGRFDETACFESYVQQVAEALDQAGLRRAAVCGVSFGGLIASAFAARYPERVTALVLVSAMPPGWTPNARVRFYLRAPTLLSPLFFLNSLRLYREIRIASSGFASGTTSAVRHAANVLTHMLSPSRMARRVRALSGVDLSRGLQQLRVPTLVVTGEAGLDLVMPVQMTREYLRIWPHARHAEIPRTGHLGLITRAEDFAALIAPFVERATGEERSGSHAPGASGRGRLSGTGRKVG
jgi:pimeloyl-ACP methyl ester carboxylesterase